MPSAAIMPARSSGLVSQRTSTHLRPASAAAQRQPPRRPLRPPQRRAGVQAARNHVVGGVFVELGMKQLVELIGLDTTNGLLFGDEALLLHLDGNVKRCSSGTLADARLKHPELALFDGELDIAHIAEVVLENDEDLLELSARLLQGPSTCFKSAMGLVLRMPATTSSPWALTR